MILARVENIKRLWELLLPSCPAPSDYQIGRWVSRFNDTELEYAVNRTAQKFRKSLPPDASTVARYRSWHRWATMPSFFWITICIGETQPDTNREAAYVWLTFW